MQLETHSLSDLQYLLLKLQFRSKSRGFPFAIWRSGFCGDIAENAAVLETTRVSCTLAFDDATATGLRNRDCKDQVLLQVLVGNCEMSSSCAMGTAWVKIWVALARVVLDHGADINNSSHINVVLICSGCLKPSLSRLWPMMDELSKVETKEYLAIMGIFCLSSHWDSPTSPC